MKEGERGKHRVHVCECVRARKRPRALRASARSGGEGEDPFGLTLLHSHSDAGAGQITPSEFFNDGLLVDGDPVDPHHHIARFNLVPFSAAFGSGAAGQHHLDRHTV